jgi:hypothetical protein
MAGELTVIESAGNALGAAESPRRKSPARVKGKADDHKETVYQR